MEFSVRDVGLGARLGTVVWTARVKDFAWVLGPEPSHDVFLLKTRMGAVAWELLLGEVGLGTFA